jgi:hypothetical protein
MLPNRERNTRQTPLVREDPNTMIIEHELIAG